MITEQRRAIAGISGHDMQENLAHGEASAGGGCQERHRIVAGTRPEADIQNRSHGQHCKLYALQQAQGTRKLIEHQLRGKGDCQHERYGIEPERIEGDGEGSSHGRA